MRIIVAGSRSITNYKVVEAAMLASNAYSKVSEIVSGGARGVDTLAVQWAKRHKVKYKLMEADWENLDAPGAVIRVNKKTGKKYNVLAGIQRNHQMGDYADALVAIWDGISPGTRDMIEYMKGLGKKVYVYRVPPPTTPQEQSNGDKSNH